MIDRREFLRGSLAGAAGLALGADLTYAAQAGDRDAVIAQIAPRHDATVRMLREWIALPSIAAEDRNYPQGAEYMARLARDAGFDRVDVITTAGKPGVPGRLDTGADTTLGVYFMYDVKQFDPKEWTSPPLEGRLVERPGIIPAPYMARNMWVQEQELGEALDRQELEALIKTSYELVVAKLPKRAQPTRQKSRSRSGS